MHRNFSDLFSVIAALARLSKHSEWLINPLLFLALKNIRPMITPPLTMQLYYVELRVLLYRILHVDLARSRSRSSTVYGTVLGVPYVVTGTVVRSFGVRYLYPCSTRGYSVRESYRTGSTLAPLPYRYGSTVPQYL